MMAMLPEGLQGTALILKQFLFQEKKQGIVVESSIDEYNKLHNDTETSLDERNSKYAALVDAYYDLATLFYEWGWGTSFHFANQTKDETFHEAIKRHEYYLASRLNLKLGAKVLDCGCGVGGPYRNIAKFTGADITGITINGYQVKRANELNQTAGLQDQCRSVQGDFMKMPFEDNSFDAVYAIEATCHAPDRAGVYSEIMRVLKPGGVFACYEWCVTDHYDASNPRHPIVKKLIEEGDGLPDLAHTSVVDRALRDVGFEVIETRDCAEDPSDIPWYTPLLPSWRPWTQRFQFNWLGQLVMTHTLEVLEAIRLAPAGTAKVQKMLLKGGLGIAEGGVEKTFTPMYLCVVRKPL